MSAPSKLTNRGKSLPSAIRRANVARVAPSHAIANLASPNDGGGDCDLPSCNATFSGQTLLPVGKALGELSLCLSFSFSLPVFL